MPSQTWLVIAVAVVFAGTLMGGCEGDPPSTEPGGPGPHGFGGQVGEPGAIVAFGDPQLGDPNLESAPRIAFGPGGVLLVADPVNERVVAIATADTGSYDLDPVPRIDGLNRAVANALTESDRAFDPEAPSVEAGDVFVTDIAVNPRSGRLYISAQVGGFGSRVAILRVLADRILQPLALDQVIWVGLDINWVFGNGALQSLDGMAWIDDRLVAAGNGSVGRALSWDMPPTHRQGALASALTLPALNPGVEPRIWALTAQPRTPLDNILGAIEGDTPFADGFIARYEAQDLGPPAVQGRGQVRYQPGQRVLDMEWTDDGLGQSGLWLSLSNCNPLDGTACGIRVAGSLMTNVVVGAPPYLVNPMGFPTDNRVTLYPALNRARRLETRRSRAFVEGEGGGGGGGGPPDVSGLAIVILSSDDYLDQIRIGF